jgi:AraC-like DNA-binding protein
MILYIKNMVNDRCKMIVKSDLEILGLHYVGVKLCEVEIVEDISEEQLIALNKRLSESGFSLISERNSILIEKIKAIIIELVHYSEKQLVVNLSDYLNLKLQHSYTYMANIFSKHQGITIEHYLLTHKIERAKELLIYNELNITEIAELLHYSSVAHLSNQFKKMTGLTPSQYRHLRLKRHEVPENV